MSSYTSGTWTQAKLAGGLSVVGAAFDRASESRYHYGYTPARYEDAGSENLEETMMSDTLQQATLKAPDISCGHCVATVKEAVGALAGVQNVDASEVTQQVMVNYDPNLVSMDRIEGALSEAGYPVQK